MTYYSNEGILIRNLEPGDVEVIVREELAQGWQASADKYETRLQDQDAGRVIALAAEYEGNVAGYVNVYPDSKWGAFGGRGYAEIVDFGVLEKYRRLMDVAEEIAAGYADVVYLGVGLHSGYGSACGSYGRRSLFPEKILVCGWVLGCCHGVCNFILWK